MLFSPTINIQGESLDKDQDSTSRGVVLLDQDTELGYLKSSSVIVSVSHVPKCLTGQ